MRTFKADMRTALLALSLFVTFTARCQLDNGVYEGLERMHEHNWYHLNTAYIRNDSVFLYKEPVCIRKKDTIHSASDGGFYYYFGKTRRTDSTLCIWLANNNCDYCGRMVKVDTVTGFHYPVIDTVEYSVRRTPQGFVLNGVTYKLKNRKLDSFPENLFYFDENSVYREDPSGQYKLMTTAIYDFLGSDSLKLDGDTLYVCTDRVLSPAAGGSIVEKLDPALLNIHYKNKITIYLSGGDLQRSATAANRPCRCIQVGEIIDYKAAARISLTYRILVPQHIKEFSGRQYNTLLEYKKKGDEYVLDEGPFIGFELIEKIPPRSLHK